MKVLSVAAETAVLRRLMNAVFFFKDESRDLLTSKTPASLYQHLAPSCVLLIHLPLSPSQARLFNSRNSPGRSLVSRTSLIPGICVASYAFSCDPFRSIVARLCGSRGIFAGCALCPCAPTFKVLRKHE